MSFSQALPASLSPSRLADFQACPRRYQYASIERIPQPASYATAKGRLVHFVFEQLYSHEPTDRTIEQAREYVQPAVTAILTNEVRLDIAMDEAMLEKLLAETEAILIKYFEMEDPQQVFHEGVELRLGVTIDGTPLFGILDRLDRNPDGTLTIVDYKTGGLPNRKYDTQTFANALCTEKLGEQPRKIRLLYVSQGEAIERDVTDVVVKARAKSASSAWDRINRYYNDGEFPAIPSVNTCRFCAYTTVCKSSGVPVPSR
jgi:putative RecB family exonuclease